MKCMKRKLWIKIGEKVEEVKGKIHEAANK